MVHYRRGGLCIGYDTPAIVLFGSHGGRSKAISGMLKVWQANSALPTYLRGEGMSRIDDYVDIFIDQIRD